VGIINQVNKEFIRHGVKFVIAVGDLTDNGSVTALDTRATYVQDLYNAGIGFYPLRGNHESSANAAGEFKRVFPQTQNGSNNMTPSNAFVYTDSANTHPAARTGSSFTCGTGFSGPTANLTGLSYAFSYDNATFVLLDQFTPASGSAVSIPSQQSWISSVLFGRQAGSHAFVFAHKGIITENHADNLFGSSPAVDPAGTDAFIVSLADNGVRLFFGGHDHMHNRSLVTTTDGARARVQAVILASDSYKFYTPRNPSIDDTYNLPAFGHRRQIQISQDLNQIGYTIVTIDGARVTAEYYGVASGKNGDDLTTTPALTGNWKLRERYGYSLNGREFLVAQGESFTTVVDSFGTTRMKILAGSNDDATRDGSNRPVQKLVTTGWAAGSAPLRSDELTVWGMTGIGGTTTAPYALSLSYDSSISGAEAIQHSLGLLTRSADGKWVAAVDGNSGGGGTFVVGAFSPGSSPGTHGIDTLTHTAWAVLNHEGEFAVGSVAGSTGGKAVVTRSSQPSGSVFSVRGATLVLPRNFRERRSRVEIFDLSGRRLLEVISRDGRVDISSLVNGCDSTVVLVRCASSSTTAHGRLELPAR
jgi:hypothetical protein